jgi:hypothetical protein
MPEVNYISIAQAAVALSDSQEAIERTLDRLGLLEMSLWELLPGTADVYIRNELLQRIADVKLDLRKAKL